LLILARTFTLDTYTSALPAMEKSAADVVAGLIFGTEEVGGFKTRQMTMGSPTDGNHCNAMVGFCLGQTTRSFRAGRRRAKVAVATA
jgi:hypothetical protein